MLDKPYIIKCSVCKKNFFSNNPYQRKHLKCKSIYKKYPRIFYYRRHFAYARDNFECQRCKKDLHGQSKINPLVHHIDGDINNNSLENLVTLCSNCHSQIHHLYTKKQLKTKGKDMFSLKKFLIKEQSVIKKRKVNLFKNI